MIDDLIIALKRIAACEVEEYDEQSGCFVLVPMSAEEASEIARAALLKARAAA